MDTIRIMYPIIPITAELSDLFKRLGISLFVTNLLPGFLRQGTSYIAGEISDAYYARYQDDELGLVGELTTKVSDILNTFCIVNPLIKSLVYYDLTISVDLNLQIFTLIVDLNSDIRRA